MQARALRPVAPLAACGVCGSHEIAVDEVYERGLWRLSTCRRCENLWTEGPFAGPRGPVAARPRRARRPADVVAA
ncbi:MAG: hypothetical protein DCC71_19735 [Proteobacteria bacterium]|nr:MAG: hypothetical protein DCC71_19735 [Pseudomonadota bacterium]